MTKEEVLKAANVMIAYANGKRIGIRPIRSTEPLLHILYVPTWNWEQKEYCVIPDPTYRPWTADEVPLGCILKTKSTNSVWLLIGRNNAGEILIAGDEYRSPEWLLAEYEHSTDGGVTWKPCGVVEEAK
jgi:hypothetical protein